MNEEIERILDTLKENYDDIGLSYYPCDLFNRDDPKILYDYIMELHERIDKTIEILKLCNSQCAEETIGILKGDVDD